MTQTSPQSLIALNQVTYIAHDRLILDHITLHIAPQQILSIVGPNGAGKTTLLKIMLGLIPPSQGTVTRVKDCVIGYVPQRMHVDPVFPMTVEAFLNLGLPVSASKRTEIIHEMGIGAILKSPLYAISGGELQRVLLTRALLRNPQLLVLDEPAQGIDLMGQSELYAHIAQIRDRQKCAIVMVSHDLNVVMAQTDHVMCLNQHICCVGTPESVSRDPAFAALFGTVAEGLAFYTHHHDHQHMPGGAHKHHHHPHEKDEPDPQEDP